MRTATKSYSRIWVGMNKAVDVLIPLFFGILLFIFYKRMIIIAAILVLDFYKIYFKTNFNIEFPLDFGLFAVILLGYSGSPAVTLLIIPIILFNRAVHGLVKDTFIIKFPLLIVITYLAYIFNWVDLALLAAVLIIFRYVAEYILEMLIFGNLAIEKLHWRLLHIIASYALYQALGNLVLFFIR